MKVTCPVCNSRKTKPHCKERSTPCGWRHCRNCGACYTLTRHTHHTRKQDECNACTKET